MVNILQDVTAKITYEEVIDILERAPYNSKIPLNVIEDLKQKHIHEHKEMQFKRLMVQRIEKQWRECNENPSYNICKKRLLKEFTELQAEL
jgi:aspartyl/asparaginyl-tRNA synthetase